MARENQTAARKTGVAAWNESEGVSTRESASRQSKADNDKRRRKVLLVLLALLCAGSIACAWPIKESITRGLWLKEGQAYSFTVEAGEGDASGQGDAGAVTSVVKRRLGGLKVSDATVHQQGDEPVLIEFPWFVDDAEDLAQTIGGKGKLELVRVDEIGDADALAKINAGTSNVTVKEGTYKPFLDGSSITSASVTSLGSSYHAITLVFNDEGKQTFADVTKELAESSGSIAIMIDGRVLSAPSVSEQIDGGQVSISGVFSENMANAIKSVVDTGELPADTTYAGHDQLGPLVGKAGLWGMVIAAAVALVAVCVFAHLRYGKLSVVVGGTAAVYGVLLMGILALASRTNGYVLTLPGVAAGVLGFATVVLGAWRVCQLFVKHVQDGASYRGAAMSCVSEAYKPMGMPAAVVAVVSSVFVFLPVSMLRDFGTTALLTIVCVIIALGWYTITSLRLAASGSMREHPEDWGIRGLSKGDAA